MATGIFGQADVAATTNTTLYTVPTGFKDSFSVNFCNRTAVAIVVRFAISTLATPTNAEYIIYDASIPANASVERTGLVAQAGKLMVVYAATAGLSCTVYGYEGAV